MPEDYPVCDTSEQAKMMLETAQRMRINAADMYAAALEFAVEQGWTNTKIAGILGISETAVRNYRKRKGF